MQPTADGEVQPALRTCITDIVTAHFEQSAPVEAIHLHPSRLASSYPIYRVTVRLASRHEYTIFLKDFGTSYIQKDNLRARRERELHLYRDLLPDANLGTATYYGSVWEEATPRYWLLLEWVDGTTVKYLPFEQWVEAACWLGQFHGHFAHRMQRAESIACLDRHDAKYFQKPVPGALRAAGLRDAGLEVRLEPIARRYLDELVPLMIAPPHTLLHGTYRAQQIIYDDSRDPVRLCPIDWEKAGIGAGLYDLSFLSYGFEPSELDTFIEAYCSGIAAHDLPFPDRAAAHHLLNCFHLYRVLHWLAMAVGKREFDESAVEDLVKLAEELVPHVF